MSTLLLLIAASLVASNSQQGLQMRFIGNDAFAISDGKRTIYVDFPYQSGAFGYMTYPANEVRTTTDSICIITHAHPDHFAPALVKQVGCVVIGTPDVRAQVDHAALPDFDESWQIGDVRAKAFATPHGWIAHFSYLVAWHSKRLYISGDTDSAAELLSQQSLDVLFVTPWLLKRLPTTWLRRNVRTVIVDHLKPTETLDCRTCVVPTQGQVLTIH